MFEWNITCNWSRSAQKFVQLRFRVARNIGCRVSRHGNEHGEHAGDTQVCNGRSTQKPYRHRFLRTISYCNKCVKSINIIILNDIYIYIIHNDCIQPSIFGHHGTFTSVYHFGFKKQISPRTDTGPPAVKRQVPPG